MVLDLNDDVYLNVCNIVQVAGSQVAGSNIVQVARSK